MKKYNTLFYYLGTANLLFFLGNSSYILLPIFLKNLGASESYIGVINNIDKVMVVISSISIGYIIQGKDRIKFLRIGYITLMIAFSSYLLISSLTPLILLIRILQGVGFSIAMILGYTIVFDIVSMENVTEAIAIYGVTGALCNALSPFIGELLLSAGYSHYLIFFLSIILVTLSLCITFVMPRVPVQARDLEKSKSKGILYLFANVKFIATAIASIIFGGTFGVLITYLPNFIRMNTNYKYSYFFLIFTGVLILIRFTFFRIINRFNKYTLVVAVFFVGAAMNIMMNFLNSFTIFVIISICWGITHGVLFPVLNTLTVSIVREHDKDKANAMFMAFFYGGMVVFALTLGFLIDYFNTYLAAFNVCGVAFLAGGFMMLILNIKHGPAEIK